MIIVQLEQNKESLINQIRENINQENIFEDRMYFIKRAVSIITDTALLWFLYEF